jgi:hypothetical protein
VRAARAPSGTQSVYERTVAFPVAFVVSVAPFENP